MNMVLGLNATFSYVADAALIRDAIDISNKYNCSFIKMKSPWWDERAIIIKGSSQNFLKFVYDFTSEFKQDIEEVKF